MMRRNIITSFNGRRITALEEDGRITELMAEDITDKFLIGRIYVGRVSRIVKNIQAAFIDIGIGEDCYYPLEDWMRYPEKEGALKEGDEIAVRISKEAVRTKAPVVTTNLTFAGQYAVVMTGKRGLFFSAAIKDAGCRSKFEELLRGARYGVIVRTNADKVPEAEVARETEKLSREADRVLDIWRSRRKGSLLYEPEPAYIDDVFDRRLFAKDEIVTDDEDVFARISEKLSDMSDIKGRLPSVRLYKDDYPLCSLVRLESAVNEALSEKVWLRSGGYLVIQPTEALTAIDVNTGKYDGHKNSEETFFKINVEAAREAAVQLRLRNLSGIIMIDFIDMAQKAHCDELLNVLSEELKSDPVKTCVLGFTRLNLVELTRKKVKKPLHEIFKNS